MATQQSQQTMEIYHERQRLWLCAKHTLNNLLQGPVFSKQNLDDIATLLAKKAVEEKASTGFTAGWMNPHKSMLGMGDYDVNVIEYALKEKGYEIQWFDSRKDPRTWIHIEDNNDLVGLILNIPSEDDGYYQLPLTSKSHWVTIRKLADGSVYDLDSKLKGPLRFESLKEIYDYIDGVVRCRHGQILLVQKTVT